MEALHRLFFGDIEHFPGLPKANSWARFRASPITLRSLYGFRRWLVKEDGTTVRQLADGEHVRMSGHHVVWLPGPEEELAIIRRVLTMLIDQPASRVAATLTAEGVPPPDAGRERTDHGVRHATSGVWHANTVTNIARNPLLVANLPLRDPFDGRPATL